MRLLFLLTITLLASNVSASAASASGHAGLMLAALIGGYSPLVAARDKNVLARLVEGNVAFAFPPNTTISIKADKVVCRASNVDITSHSCDLTFGPKSISLRGRRAHELFATIAEVGVPPDGAAGSVFEGLSRLDCTLDPHELQQKAGGGATCSFDPGPS
jgi:hypothetical protein